MKQLNNNKGILLLQVILAFAGFLDSSYLSILHFQRLTPKCTIIKGCDLVTTSSYAYLGNIPLSLIGAVFFCLIILASTAYLQNKNRFIMLMIGQFCFAGFLVSLYLLYLQIFIIKAFCQYCLLSELVSFLLLLLSYQLIKIHKEK